MKKTEIQNIINKTIFDEELIKISNKVFENQRLTQDDGLYLFQKADLSFLGINKVRRLVLIFDFQKLYLKIKD